MPALWGGGLTAAPGDILPPGSAPQEQLLLSSFSVPCQMSAVPLFLSEKPGAGRWGLLGPSHGGGRAGGAVGVPGALAWPPPAPGARAAIGQALSASDYRSSGRLWLQAPHSFQPSAALGRGQAVRAAIAGRNQPQRCCGPAGRTSPAGTHVCKRSPRGVCWLSGCCLGGNSKPEAHLAAHPGGRMLLGTPSAVLPLSALKAGYVPVPRGGCSGMSRTMSSTACLSQAPKNVLGLDPWSCGGTLLFGLLKAVCVCAGEGAAGAFPLGKGSAQFLRTQCTSPLGHAPAYVSCSTARAACPPVLWAGARRGPFPWPTAQHSALLLLLLCFTEQALALCPQPAALRALGEEVGAPLSTTGGLQEYKIPGGVRASYCRGQGGPEMPNTGSCWSQGCSAGNPRSTSLHLSAAWGDARAGGGHGNGAGHGVGMWLPGCTAVLCG